MLLVLHMVSRHHSFKLTDDSLHKLSRFFDILFGLTEKVRVSQRAQCHNINHHPEAEME